MKILKRINNEIDRVTILRNKNKKWMKVTKSLEELQNDMIGKGLAHITKYNSKKNYEDFIKKLRELFIKISKLNNLLIIMTNKKKKK